MNALIIVDLQNALLGTGLSSNVDDDRFNLSSVRY